ncbi:DUF4145 domain-containing protein [Burkholderia plantarii]|uniref:DUF4145 domain-containing protein n=1 Tax=Burkholderia plantarii TaxID=41899 RepID=UPI00272A6CD4|nr:DUF4145 domain-containing protein [Burkholderia plantarii]WLE60271.1 DUF4145 domain-containing protein [Burkholderia plantarii]
MTAKHYPPVHEQAAFNCVHCGVYADQTWSDMFLDRDYGSHGGFPKAMFWNACRCGHCKAFSFWYEGRMIIPNLGSVPHAHEDFPEDLRRDYDEARDVVDRSPRAAAALLRLCLQKLLVKLGGQGDNINNDIKVLVQGGLTPLVQQALDACRIVGNQAVHPGEISLDDSPEIAHGIFELMNFIVDQCITQPKRIQEFYASLPTGAREAVEKRDAAKPAALPAPAAKAK